MIIGFVDIYKLIAMLIEKYLIPAIFRAYNLGIDKSDILKLISTKQLG